MERPIDESDGGVEQAVDTDHVRDEDVPVIEDADEIVEEED